MFELVAKNNQWLQKPSQMNGDNMGNVTREARRIFRTKNMEYMKDKHVDLETDSKNKSIVIPRFTTLIRSSETARKAKTRKIKINFLLLPDKNNDRFGRNELV
jgi:hypothetical protein